MAYAPWIQVIGSTPQPMCADYRQLIRDDEVWYTGTRANPAGSLVLRHETDHLLLWSIAVSPASKGKNLGNRLLDFTLRRAKDLRFSTVQLFTNPKMVRNRAWYSRKGFRERETLFIGDKHVVMMSRPV